MSWGRNDDNMLEHLKWKMLEDDARTWADALALWSAARDYANRASTDGFIPDVCLRSLTPMDKKRARVVADALVGARPPGYASGLWERVEGGYQIHDFLKYNESRASKAAKADQERANAEQAEADRIAEREADAARKRAKRAAQRPDASGACPPDSTPDTDRTEAGQSTGHDSGQSADNPPEVLAPAHSRAYVRARDPGPARPDPTQQDLRDPAGCSPDQVARAPDAPPLDTIDTPLARLRRAFEKRWLAKRLPTGMGLGTHWSGFGKHHELAKRRAEEFASDEHGLARSLDGYFATNEKFLTEARYPFKSWADNPGRYIATRSEPSANAIEAMGRVPRMDVRTQ
jgi:hypothetical protein